ncbi:MAG: sulfite exporter TauE/SafE family protein, partial [Chitinophagaceae bacterium]|nr:sulfite exporter TauE/SafE family protein [Chitinophagaceae bacterium]
MLSLPVSLVAAYSYYQKGMVDWKTALLLCLGFVVGGYFGSRIAINLNPLTLKRVFAVMLLLVAMKYLFIDKK